MARHQVSVHDYLFVDALWDLACVFMVVCTNTARRMGLKGVSSEKLALQVHAQRRQHTENAKGTT